MVDTLKNKIIESHKPVGVKKSSNWKLPPSDFAYGYKVKPDPEDVSVITRSWVEHKPSKPIDAKPDFISINKLAVEKKIVDPKANKEFRKTVDIKQNVPKGRKHVKGESIDKDKIYGKRNRTPTPVKDIINNDFGKKAEEDLMKNYDKLIQEKISLGKTEINNSKENLRTRTNVKNDENKNTNQLPAKSKKFADVKSKVTENLKNLKSNSKTDNLDDLINKVEREIKQLESEKNKN